MGIPGDSPLFEQITLRMIRWYYTRITLRNKENFSLANRPLFTDNHHGFIYQERFFEIQMEQTSTLVSLYYFHFCPIDGADFVLTR